VDVCPEGVGQQRPIVLASSVTYQQNSACAYSGSSCKDRSPGVYDLFQSPQSEPEDCRHPVPFLLHLSYRQGVPGKKLLTFVGKRRIQVLGCLGHLIEALLFPTWKICLRLPLPEGQGSGGN